MPTAITQETVNRERARYLAGDISHQDYYEWLGNLLDVRAGDLPFPVDKIRLALRSDPHLNNLPLRHWDARHAIIRKRAYQHGLTSWSLSDSVCVLKAVARQLAA